MLQRLCIGIFLVLFTTGAFAAKVGDEINPISANTYLVDGNQVKKSFAEKSQGERFLVLDFFQTACVFCQKNMPGFADLASRLDGIGVARSIGLDRNAQAVIDYVEKNRQYFNFDVVLDSNREVTKLFQISGTPTTIIMENNRVIYVHEGLLSSADIAAIKQLLGLP